VYKDKNEIPVDIYAEVYINGDLYIIKGFIESDLVTEVIVENKISHKIITCLLSEVVKI
jgi:hypothetical protein